MELTGWSTGVLRRVGFRDGRPKGPPRPRHTGRAPRPHGTDPGGTGQQLPGSRRGRSRRGSSHWWGARRGSSRWWGARWGSSRWWSSRWGRGVLAVLAGALPALAFPAPSWWWFAYVALVPWLLLARSAPTARRAAYVGWLGGAGFMLAVHHWLLPSLHVFTFVIAALLGALWAPWGVLVRRLLAGSPGPRRVAAALVLVPSAWLMVELVRSWEGLGGPWGLLGSSQWQVEPALRVASVGGVWLVSLLVVAVNTACAVLIAVERARVPALAGALVVAVAASAAWAWAPRPRAAGTAKVAVVQPGVIDGAGGPAKRFAREEALTRTLAGRGVDLVVWGESSVGYDLGERPDLAARLAKLSREVGAQILVNVDARRSDQPGIFKSAILVGPEGLTGGRYDKMRLVPFGEYVPARALLGWATSVGKAASEDRRRGTAPVVLSVTGNADASPERAWGKVGPLVCFESAFPDMSRHLTRSGAQLLLAQSATSTFQDSWAPAQHASLAALRAAENGRPMVHATLTGISAVHGPDGARVGSPLGTDESAARTYEVPLATGTTLYVRFGDWAVYGALAALALLCGAETVRALRRRAPRR
ncbi:apolipoprotein N-acyltransferase [Streptomyces sp. B-S-A8]|uniref:Apolipoprotein N-acyltransferase n=1 Tax=Streptomyces solicavernae TaxID=3043614 RepID=A0ABT6RUH3_9ACTN|nr:apolipoprotein N-acyltransferase [Streptomyces sp. B-S-A8]MDI3388085.1 apolipoprotein N-acyltransferase [Streptomyces sp. B-S-A8]